MTTKKLLCLIIVALALFSLSACGGNSEPTETPTEITTEPTTEPTTENPVELAKTKLEEAYHTCCDNGAVSLYAKFGYDRMSLSINTKHSERYALDAIEEINLYLDLPSSLLEKFYSTRAIDGTQSQNCGTYTVTWNYHPDNGLKVIYEVNP